VKLKNKLKIFAVFSLMIFSLACQPSHENTHDLPTESKAENDSATRVSAENANAAEPSVASDASGNVYVVYVEHGADKSADVYLQKFDAEGKPSGERMRVNAEKGQAKSWFGDAPTIKISGDNRIYIGWTAKVEGAPKPSANVLNLSVSSDGGKTFAAPVKVNDDAAPASHGMHSLAIGADGRVFMAWLDERNLKNEKTAFNQKSESFSDFQIIKIHHNANQNEKPKNDKNEMKHEEVEPNSEVFFAASSDGGKTFSANKKLSSEVCPCCKTSVTTAPDGKIYVSWRQVLAGDFRHIAVASSANGGEIFEKPVIISDDKWQINGCPISGASMAIDKENSLKIVWYTAGEAGKPGLYYAESKDGGKTFSPRALIAAETVAGTSTVLSEAGEKSRIIFAAGNQIKIGENAANNFVVQKTIDNAQLPSAAFAREKLFVAFVREEQGKMGVWLYKNN
jgi:hypothetical protein